MNTSRYQLPNQKFLFFLSISLILLLGGCGISREAYHSELEGWIGKTEAELVEQFGPPQRNEQVDDREEILFWHSSRMVSHGSSATSGGLSFGITVQNEETCDLRFTLVDGIAKSFDWKAKRDAVFSSGEVDLWHSGECGITYPAKPKE